jgi:hypothetical protein
LSIESHGTGVLGIAHLLGSHWPGFGEAQALLGIRYLHGLCIILRDIKNETHGVQQLVTIAAQCNLKHG